MADYMEEQHDLNAGGLPEALEAALDLGQVLADEIGVRPGELPLLEAPVPDPEAPAEVQTVSDNDDSGVDVGKKQKVGKKKKLKKKRAKQRRRENRKARTGETKAEPDSDDDMDMADDDVVVEYVHGGPELDETDPNYIYFNRIFDSFKLADPSVAKEADKKPEEAKPVVKADAPRVEVVEQRRRIVETAFEEEKREEDDDDEPKISKRKWKQLNRPSIAELKAYVPRPDVVEWHDVTAKNPKLLVHLKCARNSVPVPRHWCFKRKYLAGKRGFEKPAFRLPDFIARTGIMEMRATLQEKEDSKSLKAKMREKVRPKLGKIDIDYQKLHDAFFRWQTKPLMTSYGEMYFEGKELESKMKEKKPGELTDDLRTSLGMPLGPNAFKFPPPWLIAMQRYGPPPSYPHLKIPGLNAPIPLGCTFGYQAGGWGKPPVDQNGRPLYGDVFGVDATSYTSAMRDQDIDKTLWGELESESEDEVSEESEQEEGEGAGDDLASGIATPAGQDMAAGLVTPSGVSSTITAGMETPETIELRKKKIQAELDAGSDTPQALYTVLPERRVDRVGGQLMASAHVYDTATVPAGGPKRGDKDAVELALNPEEGLELSESQLTAKYEAKLREQAAASKGDDLSDMVAEHAARQKRKRKAQADAKAGTSSSTGPGGKKSNFKF